MKIKQILNEDREINSLSLYNRATKELGCKNTISFSQLDMYTSCPLKWYLSNVKRLKYDDPSIHMLYGSAFHKLLFKWLRKFYEESSRKAGELDFHAMLLQYMQEEFRSIVKNVKDKSFTSAPELSEFHGYGMECMKYLIKHRGAYFSKRGYELIGLEYPLIMKSEFNPNLGLIIMIDILLYNIQNKIYYLKDVKTSMRGWDKEKKGDPSTKNQLLLYKKALCDVYQLSPEEINTEYMIFRNTVPENSEFPVKRIQIVSPANGKNSMNKFSNTMKEFIENCFLPDGSRNPDISRYAKTTNNQSCRWCPYKKHGACTGV